MSNSIILWASLLEAAFPVPLYLTPVLLYKYYILQEYCNPVRQAEDKLSSHLCNMDVFVDDLLLCAEG